MFGRKPKAIVPYDDNKIKPSSNPAPVKGLNNNTNTNTDILDKMRDNQTIDNYQFMQLSLLKDILLQLNKIEYNTRSTAVSNEFLGKYVLNKFKWF